MFNLSGSELVFLVLIALVVLGPDKLPEAMRRAGKAYSDFKKMTSGFQSEMRTVLEEPMRELRETADLVKQSANFDINAPEVPSQDIQPKSAPTPVVASPTAVVDEAVDSTVEDTTAQGVEPELDPVAAQAALPAFQSTIIRQPGPNFTSAAPAQADREPQV